MTEDPESELSDLDFRIPFPAVLTDSVTVDGTVGYLWAEQIIDPDTGDLDDLPGGRTGTADGGLAFEMNDVTPTLPCAVMMSFRGSRQGSPIYQFAAPGGGGGSLTVQATDGTPSVTPCGTLRFNEFTGFTLTAFTTAINVSLTAASLTNWGVVTVDPQSFAGEKRFHEGITVGAADTLSAASTITFYDKNNATATSYVGQITTQLLQNQMMATIKTDAPSQPIGYWYLNANAGAFTIAAKDGTGAYSNSYYSVMDNTGTAQHGGYATTGGLTFAGGLYVSGTVSGGGITTEDAQDATAALFAAGTHSGITFVYNDVANSLSATVTGAPWSGITSKPTTLAGYGITDAASDAELAAHEADTTAIHGIVNTADLALKSGTLAQFAATTSAQLLGVISDETGTGALVFAASPALTGTPTAPTATAGTSTTQIATTAFVSAAVSAIPAYTDEQAQDAVANALANSLRIQWTYNDTLNQISADVFNYSISDTQLRYAAGTSVIGRAAGGASGPVADIAATADGQVLTRVAGALTWAVPATGGTGTVTSVAATAPAAGLTISGSPITTSGTLTFALADDLAALEALSGTNTIYYRSAANTWSPVSMGNGLSFPGGGLLSVPAMMPAGASHAAGLPPDTSATAHPNQPRLLGDSAVWVRHSGKILGANYTAAYQATTSGTFVGLTTPQVLTFTLDEAASVLIAGACAYYNSTNAGGLGQIAADVDGTDYTMGTQRADAISGVAGIAGFAVVSLAAGAHTVTLQFREAGPAGSTANFGERTIAVHLI